VLIEAQTVKRGVCFGGSAATITELMAIKERRIASVRKAPRGARRNMNRLNA